MMCAAQTVMVAGRLSFAPVSRGYRRPGAYPTTRRPSRVRASSAEGTAAEGTARLPVFPLGMTAFPSVPTSLHIFEARYRLLFNTLLDGQADVDQAMVQDDSEFRGTQRLGLLYQDAGGKLAAVGCELLIEQHRQMADGRLLAMLRGVERFRVERVVGEAPFLVCAVTPLQDADAEADADALVSLANDVRALFASTVAASAKMQGSEGSEQPAPMDDAMDPQSVSFWVASMFTGGDEQQQLLEMDSTRARLEREREVLQATLDYLTASAAIRGAFSKEG